MFEAIPDLARVLAEGPIRSLQSRTLLEIIDSFRVSVHESARTIAERFISETSEGLQTKNGNETLVILRMLRELAI